MSSALTLVGCFFKESTGAGVLCLFTFGVLGRPASGVVPGQADGGSQGSVALLIKITQVFQFGGACCCEEQERERERERRCTLILGWRLNVPRHPRCTVHCLYREIKRAISLALSEHGYRVR